MTAPLRLRADASQRVWWWRDALVVVTVPIGLLASVNVVAAAVVMLAVIVEFGRRVRSAGIRLDATGLHWRSLWSAESVSWTLLDGLWISVKEPAGYGPGGVRLEGAAPRAADPMSPIRIFVSEQQEPDIRVWMRRNQPGITINPPAWWRDRHGHWHAEEPDADPHETMRSIRRAEVGPYLVHLRGPNTSCSVVSVDRRLLDPPQHEVGPFGSVREAVDAAAAVIDRLRADADAEPIGSSRADLIEHDPDSSAS